MINGEYDSPQQLIKDPSFPIRWPHEENFSNTTPLKHHLPTVKGEGKPQENAMLRLNGPESALLSNKYRFIDLAHELGYHTPPQMLINPEQEISERVEVAAGKFSDPSEELICKPLDGFGGLKIVELTANNLPAFLQTVTKPYIIQRREPIKGEFRYARMIDEPNSVIRRIYDEKTIPKVVGDGEKTKGQLIRGGDVPWYSKAMTQLLNAKSLKEVVPEGSSVHLSFFGTPYKAPSELEWSPGKEQRVKNVDIFMERFITDLQTRLGTRLPYLCFDIGVLDPTVLDREYESDDQAFAALKEALVPFESQMPFSVYGYAKRSSTTSQEKWGIVRRMMGPGFLGGKKNELLPSETAPPYTASLDVSEPHESTFGGQVCLVEATSSNDKKDSLPMYFSGGVGVNNLPYIIDAAEHGIDGYTLIWEGEREKDSTFLAVPKTDRAARSRMTRKETRVALADPTIDLILSQHQLNKAKTLLEVLEAEGITVTDAILQSTDALNGLLAAHEDPRRFNNLVLAFPGGVARLEDPKKSAPTVIDDAVSRIRHPRRVTSENNLRTPLKNSREEIKDLYKRAKPHNPFVDFASVALSDQGLLLHELRQGESAPGVSLVIGLEDPIFSPEVLIASLRDPNDVDFIMVAPVRHGIGYRRDLAGEIRELIPMMDARKAENADTPQQPLRDRLFLPDMPAERAIALRALADKVGVQD